MSACDGVEYACQYKRVLRDSSRFMVV